MRLPITILALLLSVPSAYAQTPQGTKGQFITQLKKMEEAAKNDVKALVECANYARQKGLTNDAQRLFNKVLKLDPENEPAHHALGFVRYKDKWMTKAAAETQEKADTEAEMKSKGLEWVEGVWVAKDQVEDAKQGRFHFDGEIVSKEEFKQLSGSKVRHPRTGQFIDKADAEKAATKFPLGDGKWGDEAEANKYHSDLSTPWVIRTHYCMLLSNRALGDLDELKKVVDEAYETLKPLFGGREPSPSRKPVVFITRDRDDYGVLGKQIGDETSSYSAFLSAGEVSIRGMGEMRIGVSVSEGVHTPYSARHATGLVYAHNVAADLGADLPLWFKQAVAGFAARCYTEGVAAFYAKEVLTKASSNLNSLFKSFAINAEMSETDIANSIYHAACFLYFAMHGNEKATLPAMQAVTASFEKGGKAVEKAIKDLEKAAASKDKEMREFLKELSKKA